ncbi:ATP-binding cassette domain-containing protein [Microbaculum marinum]|uniref:ATP-binding cassette domain-containing protein n=1 Tax=Microbaculum marinum TaxID=1764581 RepID=A0AAW9RKW1_9HYPH
MDTIPQQGKADDSMRVDADGRHRDLRLQGVWKQFGPVTAVKDVTFEARSGEIHALLGENGAGKSTLMAIASGGVRPDRGTIDICGHVCDGLTTAEAQKHGLAIVHQHPAIMPDMTVAENLLLGVPQAFREGQKPREWVDRQLQRVGATVRPSARLSDVDIAQAQLIELAKALAIDPKVLILDEPTAALTADLVDILFENVRKVARGGAVVIYISHRLQEIRQIADAVTVMRDGEVKGSGLVADFTDHQILNLIVGRDVEKTFPPKNDTALDGPVLLDVSGLSGKEFVDVSMVARRGEIVGIAGITGNGQSEFLRALAGLERAEGTVTLAGDPIGLGNQQTARRAGIIYLPPDRQQEGAFRSLSVRENATISALRFFSRLGVIDSGLERRRMNEQRDKLNIRTASIDQPMSTLSGGNQQKTLISRALLANASLLLAEEPTAGVDIGARADIYHILRDLAASGVPIVVVSSDIVELEGLCDRVLVFSRGRLVGELAGADVTESNIGHAIINAKTHRDAGGTGARARASGAHRIRTLAASDYVPGIVLAVLIVLIGLLASGQNMRFVSAFNIEKILFMSAALAFIAYGQLTTVLAARIDLSVGPLVGLTLVASSFFFNEGVPALHWLLGFGAVIGIAALVGLANGTLVTFGRFSAVAATLGIFIILQGISVLLRPYPDGPIAPAYMDIVKYSMGGVPAVFVLAVLLGIGLELALRFTRWGMSLRAVGSNEDAARHIGVRTGATVVVAFVLCSLFTMLGGLLVTAQLGIGDPNQGVEYTLASIAAVVLGGASLYGGRGSFIGVLLGAVLIQEVNSSMVFLRLSQAWQYWFIGLLTLIAVAVYSQAREASQR